MILLSTPVIVSSWSSLFHFSALRKHVCHLRMRVWLISMVQGILSKRIVAKEISWCERYITLTTEKIYIRNEKDGDIRDELSLLDITHVHKCASSVRPRKSSILPLALQLKREESLHAPGSPLEENYLARMATGSDTRRQGGKLQNRVRALIHAKRFASDLMTERPERTSSVDSYDAVEVSVEDCGMVVSPAAENEDLPRSGSREPSPGPSFAATGSSGKRGWRHLQWQNCFEIYIQQLGRMYYFRAGDDAECDSWITDIRQAVQEAEEALHESLNLSRTQRLRIQVQTIYDTDKTQMFTSLILLINFVFSISQTELDLKESSTTAALFDIIEMCFTGIYVVELLANIFGHWFRPFISSAWNWFDLIIVCLSIFDAAYVLSGGSGKGLNVLRLLRIFRIFRIFNKLDNMRRIMLAILGAMGPVLNAFLLFAVVISIYAVVGVNLFAKHGHHAFSSFSLSFYTLLGIAAGEDWTMYARFFVLQLPLKCGEWSDTISVLTHSHSVLSVLTPTAPLRQVDAGLLAKGGWRRGCRRGHLLCVFHRPGCHCSLQHHRGCAD